MLSSIDIIFISVSLYRYYLNMCVHFGMLREYMAALHECHCLIPPMYTQILTAIATCESHNS